MDTQQLTAIVSSLQAAVAAHMKHRTIIDAVPPPEPVSHSTPSATPTGCGADVAPGPLASLHGLDSTSMAASFGCVAHLLQIHRKLKHTLTTSQGGALAALSPTGVTPSAPLAAGKLQQSQPADRSKGTIAGGLRCAGHAQTSDHAEKDVDLDMGNEAGVSAHLGISQHVTGQVEWLTNTLKLPWQLQYAGTGLQAGR